MKQPSIYIYAILYYCVIKKRAEEYYRLYVLLIKKTVFDIT